jgi:hypothetical protein
MKIAHRRVQSTESCMGPHTLANVCTTISGEFGAASSSHQSRACSGMLATKLLSGVLDAPACCEWDFVCGMV